VQVINFSRISFIGSLVLFSLYLIDSIFLLHEINFLAHSIGFSLLALFFYIIYKSPNALFSPITWFILASSIYYGFGSLFYSFGGYEGLNYIDTWYYVDQSALQKVNTLNVIAISLTLLFFSIMMKIKIFSSKSSITPETNLLDLADKFAFIGLSITLFGRFLASTQGSEYNLPGIINNLTVFAHAALFIYAMLFFKKVPGSKIRFWILMPILGVLSLASLMKQEILQFLMAIILANIFVKANFMYVLKIGLVSVILLPILVIFTSFGRSLLWSNLDLEDISLATTVQEASILANDLSLLADEVANRNEIQNEVAGQNSAIASAINFVWMRFVQAPAQAAAIQFRLDGDHGDSFELLKWAFVPRLLYPDKPIITPGVDYQIRLTGTDIGGSAAPGYWADGYWNYGWFGVVFVSLVLAAFFAWFTQFNIQAITTGSLFLFPLMFLGIKMGYRVEDWFASGTINSIPFMIIIYYVCKLCNTKWYFK
jgi:hypothetical protein